MRKWRVLTMAALASVLVSIGASLVLQRVVDQADERLLAAHQAKWDCLVEKSTSIPSFRRPPDYLPEDVDYCEDAVAACRREGSYRLADQTEETSRTWWSRMLAARRIAAVSFVVLIVAIAMAYRRRRS